MELIDLVNPCYNFSISVDLTQMVKFPTWISNCDFHRPVLLDFVISFNSCISSVTKLVKFCKNEYFLAPEMCVSGGKKCSFFGKFGVLCFLETLVLRFALLPFTDDLFH